MDKKCPAIFLDRDGVLTEEKKTILKPSQIKLYEGAYDCVERLKDAGYLVFVLTNQSGVARGLYTEEELISLHDRIQQETGVDKIYYCPHHPEGAVRQYAIVCNCRKPKIGMIERACEEYNIDLTKSWVVGDRESDILMGKNANLKTILVMTGYGEGEMERGVKADIVAKDLTDAVRNIVGTSKE